MPKKLIDLMDEKGFSYRSLHSASGVAVSVIQYVVKGDRVPHPPTMRKIADALGVGIMEIDEFARAIEAKRAKEYPAPTVKPSGVSYEEAVLSEAVSSVL